MLLKDSSLLISSTSLVHETDGCAVSGAGIGSAQGRDQQMELLVPLLPHHSLGFIPTKLKV